MKKIILGGLCLVCLSANADVDITHIGDLSKANTKLIIGGGNDHFNKDERELLNYVNPAIGVEMWDIQSVYVGKNSWYEKSVLLTYTPDYKVNNYLELSLNVGVASGYKCNNFVWKGRKAIIIDNCSENGIIPMVAATVSVKPFANGLSFAMSVNREVAMFSVAYEFSDK